MLHAPDSSETQKTGNWSALADLKKLLPQAQFSRSAFDRNAYRNLLFYVGVQWIKFESRNAQWRPIELPAWFPKHQTNKFAVSCDGMKSVFEQSRPTTIYGPGSNEEEDIVAAEAANKVSDVIDVEVDQERLRGEVAAWVAMTGNAFVFDGYDMSPGAGGEKLVNNYSCLGCMKEFQPDQIVGGVCPACGGNQFIKAPSTKPYPVGKMSSEVEGPFGILFDMQAGSIDNSDFIIRSKTYPTEQLRDAFPDLSSKIQPGVETSDLGIFYKRAMAYITASTGGPAFSASFGSGTDKGDFTTLYHLQRKPSRNLPYGGEALIANEMELWKGEASVRQDDGTPVYNVTHFKFKHVPGRIMAKTPADDLVSKQIQRNKIEAILQLGAERVSNPTWLLPTGIGIENITGEPGEKLWYNGFLQGLKPERVQGMDMPASLYRWIEMIDADFEDLAATYDILKGKAPEGVSTLGATQLLYDRGMSRFADGLNSWGRGWTRVRRIRLFIWKARVQDDRTRMVLGENSSWQMEKFSQASISGNIDVRLEEGSVAPKSKAYQQMIYGQMMSNGFVDMSDPLQRFEMLSMFDATALLKNLDIDVKDAIKEREDFLVAGGVRPREIVDNHAVHLAQHVKDAKSEKFFTKWSSEQQGAWLEHIAWHFQVLQQRSEQARLDDPQVGRRIMENQALEAKHGISLEALKTKQGLNLEALKTKQGINLEASAIKHAIEMDVAEVRLDQQKSQSAKKPAAKP